MIGQKISLKALRGKFIERLGSTTGLCLSLGPYPDTLPLFFLMGKGADPWEPAIYCRKN